MSTNEIIMLIVILAIDAISICLCTFGICCIRNLNLKLKKLITAHDAMVRTQDKRETERRIYDDNLDRRLTRLEKARKKKKLKKTQKKDKKKESSKIDLRKAYEADHIG